ncbi:MAG: polyphosphate:AMP phosphotransferase [Minicystis sp.]
MFESAELGHTVDEERYAKEVPALRAALLDAQYELLASKKFSLVIVVAGVDGGGKGNTVNTLEAWMDPRHIEAHAMDAPTAEDSAYPPFYRFWSKLPPKGTIGVFFTSWYTAPILSRAYQHTRNADLDQRMDQARRFEQMLANEGTLILKFWFHLSKKQQYRRLKKLEKNDRTRFRVTEADWRHFSIYDRFRKASAHALQETNRAEAPWIVIEGFDRRFRNLTVGKAILSALRKRLDAPEPKEVAPPPVAPFVTPVDGVDLINNLDLTHAIPKAKYEGALEKYQRKLALLTRDPRFREMAVVAVFEGSDAAGKGGSIRRISSALDARQYHIHSIAAPTEDERAQPYLWRFWRHLPRRGKLSIFDRSWYGRVLVERVEGFCAEVDWMRAYSEINDFEEQLSRHRILVTKFWLQISPEEQLRRFEARQAISFKHFKITAEDWRNREKSPAYKDAVRDLVDRTSSEIAPWTLVEAEDKRYGRIKVLRTLTERIEQALAVK